tara:strand:- start:751 stop:1176 length:426 start_codon:yes stop_codon:yes gene_type:complete
MELNNLLKIKLKNDILSELNIEINDEISKLIDQKINENPIEIGSSISNQCKLNDNERCCARIMGKKYTEKRCESKRCRGDYCLKHHNMIQNQGYLSFKRYDETRPVINESGNKIPWRDNTEMEDINILIQYQNMKLLKLIK